MTSHPQTLHALQSLAHYLHLPEPVVQPTGLGGFVATAWDLAGVPRTGLGDTPEEALSRALALALKDTKD